MLEIARVKAQGEEDPIEWQLADIAAVPFNDSTVDIALCQQGLQWFPDRKATLTENGRVFKSSGRIVANVFADIEDCPGYDRLVNAIVWYIGEEGARSRRQVFSPQHSPL